MKKIFYGVLLIILSAQAVYAQPTWVLWQKSSKIPNIESANWELLNAFPSFKECTKDKENTILANSRSFRDIPGIKVMRFNPESGFMIWIDKRSEFVNFSYHCLPDTVDPKK